VGGDGVREEVHAYIWEHDHPLRDGRKLALDYKAMVKALEEYEG
jgi:hypothetical protein